MYVCFSQPNCINGCSCNNIFIRAYIIATRLCCCQLLVRRQLPKPALSQIIERFSFSLLFTVHLLLPFLFNSYHFNVLFLFKFFNCTPQSGYECMCDCITTSHTQTSAELPSYNEDYARWHCESNLTRKCSCCGAVATLVRLVQRRRRRQRLRLKPLVPVHSIETAGVILLLMLRELLPQTRPTSEADDVDSDDDCYALQLLNMCAGSGDGLAMTAGSASFCYSETMCSKSSAGVASDRRQLVNGMAKVTCDQRRDKH